MSRGKGRTENFFSVSQLSVKIFEAERLTGKFLLGTVTADRDFSRSNYSLPHLKMYYDN